MMLNPLSVNMNAILSMKELCCEASPCREALLLTRIRSLNSRQDLPLHAGATITTRPQDTLEELFPFMEEGCQRSINPVSQVTGLQTERCTYPHCLSLLVGFAPPSSSQAGGSVSQHVPGMNPDTLVQVGTLMKVSPSTQEGQILKNAPEIATIGEPLISEGGRNERTNK